LQNEVALRSGARRFLMSYDLLVRQQSLVGLPPEKWSSLMYGF